MPVDAKETRVMIDFAFVLLFFSLVATDTQRPSTEIRKHFEVTNRRDVVYTITSIRRGSAESLVLLRDNESHEQWVIQASSDEVNASYLLRDVRYEVWLKAEYTQRAGQPEPTPSSASTVLELTIETGGVRRQALLDDWDASDRSIAWRSELRRATAPALLEAMERMRPLYDLEVFARFYDRVASRLLYGTKAHDSAMTVRAAAADCGFDRSFGFECSDAQAARVRAAAKARKQLDQY
jgi:hypothetical protein